MKVIYSVVGSKGLYKGSAGTVGLARYIIKNSFWYP